MDFVDTLTNEKLTLTAGPFEVLRLGDFFTLYKYKEDLREATRLKDKAAFKAALSSILNLQVKSGYDLISLANALLDTVIILNKNVIKAKAAFLKVKPPKQGEKVEVYSWEYDGRQLAIWINDFASVYGWNLEQILNLPVNLAVYLYQEILVNKQINKEWEFNLTELAYPYNDNTKKNEHKPLNRPDWMKQSNEADGVIRVTMLRKDMLPYGVVIDVSGMGILSANEQNPKDIPNKGTFSG